jgi:2-methylcitrate dehydratase PrpD
VDRSKGSTENPLSREERENKFRDCAKAVLPKSHIDRCLDLIEHLEELKTISPLAEIIKG